jgi:hypothetical protein
MPEPTRFTGPALRLLVVKNSDQASRYPFTDPDPFLENVERKWGRPFSLRVLDERDDLRKTWAAMSDDLDCLVLLSNAPHNRTICDALSDLREDVAEWIKAGGALLALHPGITHRPDWLPEELPIAFHPLPDDRDEGNLELSDHPIINTPFTAGEVASADHAAYGYYRRYKAMTGELLATAPTPVRDCDGAAVLAFELGAGRVVLSPLLMDWHGHSALFANSLCWLTRLRVIQADGEASALLALPATGHVRLGVRSDGSEELPADASGQIRDLTSQGGYTITLREPRLLQVSAGDIGQVATSLLEERLSGGLWEASPNQTIEICRYLVEAKHESACLPALRQLCRNFEDVLGDTFVARVHALALASQAKYDGIKERREPLLTSVHSELSARPEQALVDDAPKLLLALHRAREDKLAADLGRRLAPRLPKALAPPSDRGNPSVLVRQLRTYTAARAIAHFAPAEVAFESGLHPPLRALLAAQPSSPFVLDFLEISVLGQSTTDALHLPADYFDSLLVYAFADLREFDQLTSSILVARHLAFWSSETELAARGSRLTAAAAALEAAPGAALAVPSQAPLVRRRLREAFDVLHVPERDRRIERELQQTLEGTDSLQLLRAAIGLSRYPTADAKRFGRALAVPLLGAGGIGLIPLFAKDALQTFVVSPDALRWVLTGVLLAIAVLVSWLNDAVTLRRTGALLAILLSWMTVVTWLATRNFRGDVVSWNGGPELISRSGWARLASLVEVAALPASVLLVFALLALGRGKWSR